jgi:hypothetical protein
LGRRSRKRGGPSPAQPRPIARARPSSEERNAQRRAQLEPLGQGERPTAVTVAAVIALLLAAGNIAFLIAGVELRGQETSPGGALLFAGIMLAAAAGLWRARYWAVLGFQAILALALLFAAVSLAFVSNVTGALICLGILAGAGWLFWKLVGAMARIQMPERPGASR